MLSPLPLSRVRRIGPPLVAVALVVGIVLGGVAIAQSAPAAVRLDGTDPSSHAIAVSTAVFDDAGGADTTARHAVLGRDDDFADSLAAGPLLNGGPLLYVPGGEDGTLPGPVAAELQRILPPAADVFVVGGVDAISEDIATAVEDLGYHVVRLAGEERTATAAAIADEATRTHGPADRVLVALAGRWPDAVAGGALAASEQLPLLLTDGTSASTATVAWLDAHPDHEVVVLGGPAAIEESVFTALGGDRRLTGETRAHTAAAMVAEFGDDVTGTTVMQGFADDGWVHGNAGAALLQPLLLNGPDVDTLNSVVTSALDGRTGELFVLGGTDRVGTNALTAAEAAR